MRRWRCRVPEATDSRQAAAVSNVRVHRLNDGQQVGVWRFGVRGGWPLVWCHGGLSCGLDGRFIDDAAKRFGADVIAIDRPGIGQSSRWPLESVGSWPATVNLVADRLGIGEFAVAGWSAGGPYALACAAKLTTRVRGVATLAGMAPLETARHVVELGMLADIVLIAVARKVPTVAAIGLSLARLVPRPVLRWQIRRTMVPGDRGGRACIEPWTLATHREAMDRGVRGTVEDYRRFGAPWGFALAEIPHAVSVWQGELDTLLPIRHARRLVDALPSGMLRTVPAVGHHLPAAVGDAVIEDLANQSGWDPA
jgi:pimeloyl-ACP methyl ester carboxylesterase